MNWRHCEIRKGLLSHQRRRRRPILRSSVVAATMVREALQKAVTQELLRNTQPTGPPMKLRSSNMTIDRGAAGEVWRGRRVYNGLPFTERHPVAAFLTSEGLTGAESFLGPYAARRLSARLNRPEMQRWNETLANADQALTAKTKAGALTAGSKRAANAAPYAAPLEKYLDKPPTMSPVSRGLAIGLPATAATGAMAFPQEWDYITAPKNSEARRQAEEKFKDPAFWLSRAAFGALPYSVGSGLGWKLPAGEMKPPIARQGILKALMIYRATLRNKQSKRRAQVAKDRSKQDSDCPKEQCERTKSRFCGDQTAIHAASQRRQRFRDVISVERIHGASSWPTQHYSGIFPCDN